MKIVINRCFGGFSLSEKAYEFLGKEWDSYGYEFNEHRTDPQLVECVEKLGDEANGRCARLKVIEIPDDVKWDIYNYDGLEFVYDVERVWGMGG